MRPFDVAHLEVRLEMRERLPHAPPDVPANRVRRAPLVAREQFVHEVLVQAMVLRVGRRLRHREPDRRERVRLLDGVAQRGRARALGDAVVELLMLQHEQRAVRLL